jgi:hypothetical protein
MKQTYRHTTTRYSGPSPCSPRGGERKPLWLLLPLLLLCLAACSSSDEEQTTDSPDGEQDKIPTQLYIYVHTPQTAVPTRAYPDDDVAPIGNEAKVYSLQIWVFTHDTNKLIGYFSPTGTVDLNKPEGSIFQLTIDEEYAQATSHENVDVYVLANVSDANCHLTLDHSTTRAQLEAAVLTHGTQDPFGLTAPVTTVTEGVGLPMSGVLREQPVAGTAPVLRLDNGGQMATVSLIRTVSKLRFAFANQTGSEALIIKSIKLNTTMIPEEQYLFMANGAPYNRKTCHINTASGYNTTTPELLAATINDVPDIEQPVIYAWGHEELEPQAYEHMLDVAAAEGNLAQRLYYLRESDKQLQGEIKYQIGDGEEQTATFKMVDEGDFSRNHIWTVYAYQAQARLHVVVVDIAPWKTTETNYDFYNW